MNDGKLEEETSFKYLGATLSKDGTSTAEARIYNCFSDRIDVPIERVVDTQFHQLRHQVQALQVPRSLNRNLRLRGHSDTECRIQAFEHKCLRKLFHKSYTEQNQRVRSEHD
ncbi:hypothetical protein DPMN_168689 [Dreissena polymorpha]|uniref:Uncharacterized protein n=1 Tax=Dreissena polymorpha TaxID=45954 RepID=A0A9D4F701_DREPO|nr:hypothetical protein DPMN_168689 [Dreissena polymorpha]